MMLFPLKRLAVCAASILTVVAAVAVGSQPAGAARLPAPAPAPAPAVAAPTCGGTQIAKSTGGNWTCTFDDEFTGSTLNPKLWTVVTTASSGYTSGGECYVNSPNTVSVSGGYLNLTVRRAAAPFTCVGSYTSSYTSGMVTTSASFAQAYGRFEVRAAFPAATVAGLQTSFWMLPAHPTSAWPVSGEIDLAEEYSSYPDRAIPYVHYAPAAPDPNVTNNWCMITNVAAQHTYTMEWSPSSITISYDGQTCIQDSWNPAAPLAAPQPFNQPFYLLLTQALGINANAPTAATPSVATTSVDYVRAWS